MVDEQQPLPQLTINPKENPGLLTYLDIYPENDQKECQMLLSLWKLNRYANCSKQNLPRFAGWIIKLFHVMHKEPTRLTYLPPIPTPITQYGTIIEIFLQSRQMAKQCNMQYTHITMDVGAAIKAYHVLWNNPQLWSDIIIHLGDFHTMMTFFGVIGSYVKGSGFEEIVFQAGLCSSGTITGVISGKHYNRCWRVHESLSEAVNRLFIKHYLPECVAKIKDNLGDINNRPIREFLNSSDDDSSDVKKWISTYQEHKSKALKGDYGKTVQYWIKYTQLVDLMHMLHYAVSMNDYDLRLKIWSQIIPYCFALNRIHYARYGCYYVNQMQRLEETHPGAKEEINQVGLSVRRNDIGAGQAIDLAGEQTYMKSAKTAGNIETPQVHFEAIQRVNT